MARISSSEMGKGTTSTVEGYKTLGLIQQGAMQYDLRRNPNKGQPSSRLLLR